MSKNLILRLVGSFTFAFALCSCSTVFLNDSDVASLNVLGAPRTLEMHMHLTRAPESYTMDLFVEVRKQELTIIGSSFGVRVFTLKYDGDQIAEGAGTGLPFYVPNKLIVDDVILALSSKGSLERGLPKSCHLISAGDIEEIYCNENLLVSIKRQKTVDNNDQVLVERFQPEYKVNFIISEVK